MMNLEKKVLIYAMTDGNKLLVAAAAESLVGVQYLQLNAHRLEEMIPD